MFSNIGSDKVNNYSSTIEPSKSKLETLTSQQSKMVNISHVWLNETEDNREKDKRCAISCEFPHEEADENNKSQSTTLLQNFEANKRPSYLVRPKTSLGRNHSLYTNNNKFNFSLIQAKPPVEQYNTNRSVSEQGNGEGIVNTTYVDSSLTNINEVSKDANGQPQGQPKLTK